MQHLIVISGVAGMTGSMITQKLLSEGKTVIGFDNFFCSSKKIVEKLKNDRFIFFEYDINNEKEMHNLFDYINKNFLNYEKSFINCAAVVHTKHFYKPDDTFLTNVVSMKNSLERCIQNRFDKYINCSTSEVYSMESWKEDGVQENAPVLLATAEQTLRTSYAAGKLMTEFFMRDAVETNKIKGCSIRFANVYSPNELFNDHIIPHIISSLIETYKIVLLENAKETRRTFLNNSDSCNALLSLMNTPKALNGSVYNVGTTEEIYIVDLVKKIADLMKINNVQIDFKGVRSCDPKRRLLNIDKIQNATGWRAEVSLEQGLIECIKARQNEEIR